MNFRHTNGLSGHQVTHTLVVSLFILKEKLIYFEDAPLPSVNDIKELVVFELYKNMYKDNVIERIFNRDLVRRMDINKAFTKKIKSVTVEFKLVI
jgi:hypothetical protein